jgi:hypothetical protein
LSDKVQKTDALLEQKTKMNYKELKTVISRKHTAFIEALSTHMEKQGVF